MPNDSMASLDDILSEKPRAPVEVPEFVPQSKEAEPKSEAPAGEQKAEPVERAVSRRKKWQQKERDEREAGEGRVRDPETGKYVAKTEAAETAEPAEKSDAKPEAKTDAKPETPTAPKPEQEFTPKERALLAAAMDERRKRQAMEQQLAAMQQNKPAEQPKQFWDDPEQALKQFEQQITHATLKTKLDVSESIARTRHTDFDEKVGEFANMVSQYPGMREEWLKAPDPAEFAYQVAKRQMELRQIGDIEEYRAKIERETRAKLEAEYAAKEAARRKAAEDLTPSLSAARGSTPSARPIYTGPTSLDTILGKN